MNYQGVHPDRLSLLLEHALTDEELKTFFRSCQKRLILAGEHKIQRLPGDREEAIRVILRFSEKAHAVLAEWLGKQSGREHAGILPSQLVARFRAIEREGVEFDQEEMRDLCRCGLDDLYGEAPTQNWLSFLASEPAQLAPSEASESLNSLVGADEHRFEFTEDELEGFVKWARGEAALSTIAEPRLTNLARLDEAARSSEGANADALRSLPPEFTRLRSLLQTPKPTSVVEAPKRGVQAAAPEVRALDRDVDYSIFQIVATRSSRSGSGTYFLDVEAFIDKNGAFSLSDDDLPVALPEEGRVILFPDAGITPVVNRPASYQIERVNTTRPIKVRVISHGRPLYQVFYVPFSSDEHDSVRDWILQLAKKHRGYNAIFITADGLCLRPRVEPLQRVEGADFEWLLDAWPTLNAVEFRNGTFVLGPLSPTSSRYDCAPVSMSARRLFRVLAERKTIKITRDQISAIVGYIRDADDDEVKSAHRSRILRNLSNLSRKDEEYEELIAELMKSPAVLEDIEARKQAAIANAKLGVQKEQKQLDELRRQRQAVEQQLAKLKGELDERVTDMRKALRRAFEVARNKEAEALGDLALWQVLSGNTNDAELRTQAPVNPAAIRMPACNVTEFTPTSEDTSDVFRSVGFPEELCSRYAPAIQLAAQIGLPIVFAGVGAAAVGLRVARSLHSGPGLCIDIPVGLISGEQIDHCLVTKSPGVVLLRNANLSDICLYAPTLLDEIVTRVLDPPSGERSVVILTAASGPAALPWAEEIEHLAVKFDLSRMRSSAHPDEDASEPEPASPLQRKAWLRIQLAGEESEAAQATASVVQELMRG